jgi:hypothetical protein
MDRKGFMFAPAAFGNGTFNPFGMVPIAPRPAPPPRLAQAPSGTAPDRTGRTGTEMITIIVLGLAVLGALEVAGVTNILGRKKTSRAR